MLASRRIRRVCTLRRGRTLGHGGKQSIIRSDGVKLNKQKDKISRRKIVTLRPLKL